MQGIWEWLHLEKCFFSKSARRQRTCMYVRIVRDISLIFNEFKDAPLWFLCNYYTARIRIRVNLDQGKRNLVRFSKKFELSKGESEPRSDGKIQGKWFQLAVSSSYPSSSYTGGLGRFSSIFLSLFAIDQLRKIKYHRMETIIHKMRRVKKDQTSQCFQFIRPFDLIIEDRMSSLQFLLPTPLSIMKLKPLPATEHVHRGKPLAFPNDIRISEWY